MRGQLRQHRQVRRHRLIVALCLTLFQVQLFAASTLGCLNATAAGTATGCPFHTLAGGKQTSAEDSAASALPSAVPPSAAADPLDCPKCALKLGLHCAATVPVLSLIPSLRPADAHPLPARHFYRFSPKQPEKPPIRRAD